jgi:peptidyl-tRNA hydrolase
MGAGKVAAQVGHAVGMLMGRYMAYFTNESCDEPEDVKARCEMTRTWLETSYRKVVLRADDREWESIKEQLWCFVVLDAGLTEVDPGSETVIALWPMRKSEAPKVVKRLQTLR